MQSFASLRRFALTSVALACSGLAVAQTPPQNAPVVQPETVQAPGNQGVSATASSLPPAATRSPFYLGVQQGFTYEDNVRGASNGAPKFGDWVSTTTLRGGVNQPISRQRFFADANVRFNKYADRSELDNTAYSLSGGWDWATAGNLSGVFSAQADQNLSRPALTGGQRNVENVSDINAVARLGGVTALTLEAGLNYRRVDHSNPGFALLEFNRTGAHGALLYRLSPATSVGLGVAGSRSKYPFNGDQANRRDVYLQGSWTPTAATDVQARVARTQNEFDIMTGRNYSGATGSLVVNHRPTGKLATSLYAARDTGGEIGFLRLTPDSNASVANVSNVSTVIGARATWELTSKVLVDAGLSLQRRATSNLVLASGGDGRETLSNLQLGARWLATRNITAGCQITREARNLTTSIATAQGTFSSSSDPVNNAFGCFGSYTIY